MKRLTIIVLALFSVATLNAQVEDDWLNQMKKEQGDSKWPRNLGRSDQK